VNTQVLHGNLAQQLRAFYALTKPRVVSLIVFTAVIGMFLAVPGMVPGKILLAATLGIALVAALTVAVIAGRFEIAQLFFGEAAAGAGHGR